jgi:hypothetical protein
MIWHTYFEFKRPHEYIVVRARLDNLDDSDLLITFRPEGNLEIRHSGNADSAARGIQQAMLHVNRALLKLGLDFQPIAIKIHPAGTREPMPKLLGPAEISDMLRLTKPRVTQLAKTADFPLPIAVLRMGPVYSERDIEEYSELRAIRLCTPTPLAAYE